MGSGDKGRTEFNNWILETILITKTFFNISTNIKTVKYPGITKEKMNFLISDTWSLCSLGCPQTHKDLHASVSLLKMEIFILAIYSILKVLANWYKLTINRKYHLYFDLSVCRFTSQYSVGTKTPCSDKELKMHMTKSTNMLSPQLRLSTIYYKSGSSSPPCTTPMLLHTTKSDTALSSTVQPILQKPIILPIFKL